MADIKSPWALSPIPWKKNTIELIAGNQSLTCFLQPGDKPEAVFMTDAGKVTARAYCNLHGHWKSEN